MGTVPSQPVARIAAIDAYRGFVMLLMMAEVLHFGRVAKEFPRDAVWQTLAGQQRHVEWVGCTLHDTIQPSFSFLVGAALPFSLASRLGRGQPVWLMALHAAWRSFVLVALGIFLRSVGKGQTNFTFEDTLTQIGLGYFFLFLLGFARPRWQWAALVIILVGYWAGFALYALPAAGLDPGTLGVPPDWPQNAAGFAAHWNKNTNLAMAFDQWFLNLFPRDKPFDFNGGGYATLSFIPTLGTMILGLIAGGWLKGNGGRLTVRAQTGVLVQLVVAGGVFLAAGLASEAFGVCPIVKRIWTPAWTLYSGGWCFLSLAGFYAIMDVIGFKAWAFPLRVIGANSIMAYCMAHLIEGFVIASIKVHLGKEVFKSFGPAYERFATGMAVLAVFWLILLWMYRRRIFVRI